LNDRKKLTVAHKKSIAAPEPNWVSPAQAKDACCTSQSTEHRGRGERGVAHEGFGGGVEEVTSI
jgi:hypothetical protein